MAAVSLLPLGCDSNLLGDGALVHVFATHHATPENGQFPDRGGEDQARIFENDLGWEITLAESFVTITAVTLIDCGLGETPLDMFWGPCPEDMRERDLETVTVAGSKASPGNYCGLRLQYGPYEPPDPETADEDEARHVVPESEGIIGRTVYLRGRAQKGDLDVQFDIDSDTVLELDLDISQIEGPGRPMQVERREDFPKELTITKTYDRYFDGIDFANVDEDELESLVIDVLAEQTRVVAGTAVVESDAIDQ